MVSGIGWTYDFYFSRKWEKIDVIIPPNFELGVDDWNWGDTSTNKFMITFAYDIWTATKNNSRTLFAQHMGATMKPCYTRFVIALLLGIYGCVWWTNFFGICSLMPMIMIGSNLTCTKNWAKQTGMSYGQQLVMLYGIWGTW